MAIQKDFLMCFGFLRSFADENGRDEPIYRVYFFDLEGDGFVLSAEGPEDVEYPVPLK